jgi:16S rRNA C1402 (ribose-2'-O) methylase RsmI
MFCIKWDRTTKLRECLLTTGVQHVMKELHEETTRGHFIIKIAKKKDFKHRVLMAHNVQILLMNFTNRVMHQHT